MQFRELEFVSGAKDEKLLTFFADDEFSSEHLQKRFDSPSLADVFWELLKRRGFGVETADERVASIVKILEKTEKNPEIYIPPRSTYRTRQKYFLVALSSRVDG